ncbi:glycosyltransferase family 4 protein [Dysgonomonas massiliensis]|uniref:glycosyltransferase family 4 protein n=1 Tax=Dysgonomonas massiliensis TaxID=2040292 RepID=UPI000C75E3D6|nr:glycosyltransferase family 4 protein [Dysgonomonas massiliensis]
MKIAIINNKFWPDTSGGSQISTRILAENLADRGHEVVVVTLSEQDTITQYKGFEIRYIKIPFGIRQSSFSTCKKILYRLIDQYNIFAKNKLVSVLKEVHPDVIHTNCIEGLSVMLWDIAKSLQIPVVHTTRDYYLTCMHGLRRKYKKTCNQRCLECRCFSAHKCRKSESVAAVVGISDFIFKHHLNRDFFTRTPIKEVIYNPVDFSCDIIKEVEDRKIIGYIGRIDKQKGIEFLLNCFTKVNCEDSKLLIGGEGDAGYVDYLKKTYSDERIKFLGKVDSFEFYKKIGILVVPSLWEEPFGRVVAESIACRCPILVSNKGGMPEVIEKGHYGIVFNTEDSSLFNYLNMILKDNGDFYKELLKMVPNKSPFDINNIISDYIKVYKKAISKYSIK